VYNEIIEINDETDFILVDMRDPADFSNYHIKEAYNVPGYQVYQNRLSQEMIEFKNKPNCLIVVYHDFEKSGIQYITILGERGYENAFLLSGGIEDFMMSHGK